MSEAKSQTAEDLLLSFYLLPESEQARMLERLSAPSQFQEEKITEIYKGREIEVFRSEVDEKLRGCKCWTAFYHDPNGKKIDEPGLYRTAEECLEVTRAVIDWEIEQEEMLNQIKELFSQFKTKGYTQAGLLRALTDALSDSLDEADWKKEVIQVLKDATISAWLPGRVLP